MTWGELLESLKSKNINLHKGNPQKPPWDGNQSPCDYLESGDGKFMSVCFKSKQDGVTPTTFRCLCGIFGLTFDDFGIDEDHFDE
jgi:hypothetical protein